MSDEYVIVASPKSTAASVVRVKDGFSVADWKTGGNNRFAAPNALSEFLRLSEEITRLEELCIGLGGDMATRCEGCDGVFSYDDLTPDEDGGCYFCEECAMVLRKLRKAPGKVVIAAHRKEVVAQDA